jgi:hypothetical protein
MAISKRLRYEVLRRDRHTCQMCGATAPWVRLEIDHIIPRHEHGQDVAENLQVLCQDCNSGKRASMPEKWQIAEARQAARDWKRGRGREPEDDDYAGMYAYMDAYADLGELGADQVLACIAHVMAEVYPYRPDGAELIRAAAVLARDGYGAPAAEVSPLWRVSGA